MKRFFFIIMVAWMAGTTTAQMTPIYYEGFSRCYDDEGENYGYTGGNDNQWGGDIAKAQVIYQDAPEWSFTYCNGANRCLKVGTSTKQGSATTPFIACEGEVELSFRAAPWEGDSILSVSINGGTTTDPTGFNLKKHQWTDITIRISDISTGINVTFSSLYKHRFFLDDVTVRPADPNAGAIRLPEGTVVDFGLVGYNYSTMTRTINVEGANLAGPISATLADGETSLFALSGSSLPATGGTLTVTCQAGATTGMHGCYLYLRGTDNSTQETIQRRVTVTMETTSLYLQGSGTKPDPYTCQDVILLAAHEGTVWSETYYWATGYILGAVKRYNETHYDGICQTDRTSLVLADNPNETDDSKYVTVQISDNARAALNVVDNAELVGQQVKVQGYLLNSNANPWYLEKPGVMNVRTDAQYVLPETEQPQGITETSEHSEAKGHKVLINGQLYIRMNDGSMFNLLGARVR